MVGWDIRYALRLMARSPGFTAVAVISLALGIGANTAIFSVTDALLLKTLPVRHPEELVTFARSYQGREMGGSIAYPMFEKFRNLRPVFADMAAVYQIGRSNLTVNGPAGGVETGAVHLGLVSGNYFSMLGVGAALGRTFTAEDDRASGGHPVAVISYRYWDRRFGLDSAVLGRTFTLNSTTFTILGVAAKGFWGEVISSPTDVWIPMAMQSQVMPERPGLVSNPVSMWVTTIGRLAAGVTIQQAQPPVQVTFHQLVTDAAGGNPAPQFREQRIELTPASTGFSAQRQFYAQPLRVLMMVVGLVLLIACANVANLLLARSAGRQREMAVRLAIGAGRARIVRQLLTESVLLAGFGGVLGLLFARWGTNILMKMVAVSRAPMYLDIHPDVRIFAFTAALCLATGILFGLAPASNASRLSLAGSLAGRGTASGGGSRFSLGKLLVISQVALSLMLLIGAGLFLRTFRNLESQDLGFDRQHVLLIWTSPGNINRQGRALEQIYENVEQRLAALPGVIAASASRNGVLSGFVGIRSVSIPGYTPQADEELSTQWSLVGPKFFDAIGMRLQLGRAFTALDSETSPRVAIINETMARDYFPGQNPVGKQFILGRDEMEIVGVVRDSKYFSLRDKAERMVYLPYRQDVPHLTEMCIAVRTSGDVSGLVGHIRDEIRAVEPKLPIPKIDSIEEQVSQTLVEDRLVAVLSGFFGVLAVLLACLGLYGVMSYTSARRTNEIGIRLALGATRVEVLSMVLRESLGLTLAGIAIGVGAALAAARLLSSLLFGVSATDPMTIAGCVLAMILVAALAGFVPARRAARVDPMVALRYE